MPEVTTHCVVCSYSFRELHSSTAQSYRSISHVTMVKWRSQYSGRRLRAIRSPPLVTAVYIHGSGANLSEKSRHPLPKLTETEASNARRQSRGSRESRDCALLSTPTGKRSIVAIIRRECSDDAFTRLDMLFSWMTFVARLARTHNF